MRVYDPKKRIMTQQAGADNACLRVLLQPGTVVMVKTLQSFAQWKARYPNARILDAAPEQQEIDAVEGTENALTDPSSKEATN